jgi:hypothetical protein
VDVAGVPLAETGDDLGAQGVELGPQRLELLVGQVVGGQRSHSVFS